MIRQKRRRRVYRIPTAFQKWCAHIREGIALTCQHCGAELRPEHCDKTLNKHFRNKCQSDRNDVSPCVPNGPEATSNWALPAGGFALPNTGQNHFAGDDYLREYLNHIEMNPGYDDDGPSSPPRYNCRSKRFKDRLDEPLFGEEVTLRSYLLDKLHWYLRGGVTLEAFEYALSSDARMFRNIGIEIPDSMYMLERTLEIPTIDSVEYHICTCEEFLYPHAPKDEWESIKDDKCGRPECGTTRFQSKETNRRKPRKRFYYFGLERQIRAMFLQEEFCKSRTSGREFGPDYWYGASHSKWVNEHSGNILFSPDNSAYSIGFDWFGAHNFSIHSIGVISLRCEDVHPKDLSKRWNSFPLIVIPGPEEPKVLDTYFELITKDFMRLMKEGISISYTVNGQSKNIWHRPIPVMFHCDAKATEKLGKFNGSGAIYPCRYCRMPSVDYKPPGATKPHKRLFGYAREVTGTHDITIGDEDREYNFLVGSRERKLSHDDFEARASYIESRISMKKPIDQESRSLGCSGSSYIFDCIPTLHRVDAIQLPFYHMLFLGIVKGLLRYWYHTAKGEYMIKNKTALAEIEDGFTLNCGFSRPYKAMSTCGTYISEDTVRFLEVFSVALFNEKVSGIKILSAKGKRAWGFLRRGLSYFMDEEKSVLQSCNRQNAKYDILEYSKICEEDMQSMCTPNLHYLSCRLFDQELATGKPKVYNENWVERSLGFWKQNSTSKDEPTRASVKRWLQRDFLSFQLKFAIHMDDYVASDDERYDSGEGTRLLYKGKSDPDKTIELEGFQDGSWTEWFHTNAEVCHSSRRVETYSSEEYSREHKKQSNIALLRDNEGRIVVVRILIFARASNSTECRRFVKCDILKEPDVILDRDTGDCIQFDKKALMNGRELIEEEGKWFPLESLITKLAFFQSKKVKEKVTLIPNYAYVNLQEIKRSPAAQDNQDSA